ncbi:MAG: HPr(Ser) kinase/phosphatase [Gemmatimonadetes bacterium]|uniref:HPr kinase/phosphorylase n=1 Tax=Candidatus Kutchimonas denitrificans TaxID=3056748 RepID=A0AAE4ZBA1_9BACT|nr:HPr(Ser) kinase/phosphatase [Gemmatimonadota bacterium]NIR75696.1 HPr(Ser) kinase/phosphatase [Candidatus Kutchimonas denitrificans]NIS00309.1 HPr(Ser) kinase/phosphatase [Gemmatimonadota bacterium]NIT65968.1 HPr(Ser) kinase/phosphatase [Gemmatimonadota bacterium]NIU53672.1 HPr(Ser) kinase/phosphatase [Gemmatimonadota bacterium]
MSLTVGDLLELRGESLQLHLATSGERATDRVIRKSEISSPGLVLAGFTERFAGGRVQVLGETEISYLRSLSEDECRRAVETLLSFEVPCVIVTKGQRLPPVLVEVAEDRGTAIIVSALKTAEFYRRIIPFINDHFAPQTHLHGSLADVYGVGLLFVGRSGIGKSECVLDLVERGHRLVADDVVHISRQGHDVLIGRGHELARHHMEIRGIGIIDVQALFGIRAIRQQKRIEVVVKLVEWHDRGAYERTGLDAEFVDILDVPIPRVTVPLNPGKNITVISEVVAMNHLLRYAGIDSAGTFDANLQKLMAPVREYLEEDYE